MFKNQTHLEYDDILFMTEQIGLDQEAFKSCLDSEKTAAKLAEDIEDANTSRLYSTPTLFVKGLHPDGWIRITMGTEALDLLLGAHSQGTPLPPRPVAEDHSSHNH